MLFFLLPHIFFDSITVNQLFWFRRNRHFSQMNHIISVVISSCFNRIFTMFWHFFEFLQCSMVKMNFFFSSIWNDWNFQLKKIQFEIEKDSIWNRKKKSRSMYYIRTVTNLKLNIRTIRYLTNKCIFLDYSADRRVCHFISSSMFIKCETFALVL